MAIVAACLFTASRMRCTIFSLLVLLGCAPLHAGAAEPAAAADPLAHEREWRITAEVDPALTLGMALDAAWDRAPGKSGRNARTAEARSLHGQARSLLSGAPAAQFRYQTDRWQSTSGLRELEAGIELPLWRPGQRSARATEAEAAVRQGAGEQSLQRWMLAGELRERYWSVIEAREQRRIAQRDLEAFAQLEQDVLARIAAGDAAPLERLTAEGQRRDREAVLHEAEVRLADTAFAWRTLTGWSALPSAPMEALQSGSTYPPLVHAEGVAARARTTLAYARAEGVGAPRLLLGARSEDAGPGEAVDSLGATLTIPFGGSAHRAVALSAPQLALALSEDEMAQAEREAVLVRHEAEHELHAREKGLLLVAQRLSLAMDEIHLARRAYQIGETSLAERVLAEIRTADAARNHALALIARDRALSRYNHIQGVLP